MKLFLKPLLLLLFVEFSYGQYTEVINSRRPGFSDSPYSIGTKVYQVEGGIFYRNVGNYLYFDSVLDRGVSYSATGIATSGPHRNHLKNNNSTCLTKR